MALDNNTVLNYTDKTTIKNWFKTGLKPTQTQFWSTWDSFWHKSESLPISSITNLANLLDSKAEENHEHNQYAKNDATSLTADNVTVWQQKLGVADLKFDDKAITTTQDYADFGLQSGATINAFNNAVYTEVAKKLDAPTENATNEYVLMADASVVAKSEFGKVDKVMGVAPDANKNVDISGVAMNWTNASQRFSGLVDKSADATYNVFPVLDNNGNVAKASNSYNALLNSLTLMTPTQKVDIMKLFNGQYSSGQIKTDMILMPVIEIGDNLNGLSKLDIYGANLLIDPDTSYVRIKEFGNVNNWEDCVWNNVDSTRLEVFVNNSFLEIGKTYVFEIKHSVQVHTTPLSIDVVQQLNNVDLSTLTYTITKDKANNADDYLDISVDSNGLISHSVKAVAPENLRGKVLKKVRINPIAQYSENLVIIIDFNWDYGTNAFEFSRHYDKMGLSKVIQYTENDVSDNIVAGVATGFQSFNGREKTTAIIGGGFIGKSGIGQCIIVKKGGAITTVLMMDGTIIRYSSNAAITENYAVEFYFVGRYLNAKSVGTYNISSIKKF